MTENPKPITVALCVPSGRMWEASFAMPFVQLSIASIVAGINAVPVNHKGGDAAENRNRMVDLALKNNSDWLMFFDADMVFPADALIRLLKWNLDIVGADYRLRQPPFTKLGTSPEGPPYPPGHIDPAEGLVERGMLGLGLLLVRASVFRSLEGPWFTRTWIRQHATLDNPYGFATDDCVFCNYARIKGFKTWCDMGVTQETMHIGETYVPWRLPGDPS